jgi:hypothetical protein
LRRWELSASWAIQYIMIEDKLKIEIEQLKKDVFSDDWDLVKSSADRLGKLEVMKLLTF